jgi:hypothetical protein
VRTADAFAHTDERGITQLSHRNQAPQLNANQRRSVEALLESVEAMLTQTERLMPDTQGHDSGVTIVTNDLPPQFSREAPEKILELRAQVRELAERIELAPRRISKRRSLRGMLSAQLMRVEDVTPARLSSYGEVHPSFGEQVSPALKQIQASLRELLELLHD